MKIKIPTTPEVWGIMGKDVGIFNVANTLSRKSASETNLSQVTGYLQQITSKALQRWAKDSIKKTNLY